MRLILASASPRRAELLRAAGFEFDVMPAAIDESTRAGESAALYVRRLAAEKSAAVSISDADRVVLGADTVVVVDGRILGKPRDDEEAAEMLHLLSGRAHTVLTGVSLRRGAFELGRVGTTQVQFATLDGEDISWYLASGEGRDKAGAYAIQGLASRFVTSIDGSYANVVGLPIADVHALLSEIASGPASGYSGKQISPRKSL